MNLELSLVRRLPWVDTWEISWTESTVWEINEESYSFDKVHYGFRTNVRISFEPSQLSSCIFTSKLILTFVLKGLLLKLEVVN